MVGGAYYTIYTWDITNSDPHLVKTLVGHTGDIVSITLSSSLISTSHDQSIKFWQIGTMLTDLVTTNSEPIPQNPPAIWSVTLQTNDGTAISIDSTGVVRFWDIITSLCKASFNSPDYLCHLGDMWLINNRLIFIQYLSGPLWPDLITTSNERLCTVRLSQKPGNQL